MKNQLLLLEDVHGTGRSGDLVKVKPGYARNFLLPQKKAVVAGKHTVRMRAKLQEEREKKAVEDRKKSEGLASVIKQKTVRIEKKVDPQGKMYGSVTGVDVVDAFAEEKIVLHKKDVILPHTIKKVGVYEAKVRLLEGVIASYKIEVVPDKDSKLQEPEPKKEEEPKQEEESKE